MSARPEHCDGECCGPSTPCEHNGSASRPDPLTKFCQDINDRGGITKERLEEMITAELLAHGEFGTTDGSNRRNAAKAANAVLTLALQALDTPAQELSRMDSDGGTWSDGGKSYDPPAPAVEAEPVAYSPQLIRYDGEGDPYWEIVNADVASVTDALVAANVEFIRDLQTRKVIGLRVYAPSSPVSAEVTEWQTMATFPTDAQIVEVRRIGEPERWNAAKYRNHHDASADYMQWRPALAALNGKE